MQAVTVPDNTPVIIGVGQVSEKPDDAAYRQRSPADLAADAARAACDDALSSAPMLPRIDGLFVVRTVADSVPAAARAQVAPFGGPDNAPAAVARRLGIAPTLLVYSPACGDEPQKLLGEACERLAAGELRLVLLTGAEATSTQRAAKAAGLGLDWNEHDEAPVQDRGGDMPMLRTRHMGEHKLLAPTSIYPLLEHARRSRLGLSREAYALEMGRLFAPFSAVAAAHPHASSSKVWSAQEIATPGDRNRMIADPHTISMVARDQVNQGAAVLLTTVGEARALGVPEKQWVFLHGYSALAERMVLEREDLGASKAMALAYEQALKAAGVKIDEVRYLDIYSCFPIAVFAAIDALGLQADDPRGLTLTGGLPYFGGPGNNYSMHGIAEVVGRLRADPGSFGLVGANGGFMSTHAVGVYSTTPKPFQRCSSAALQAYVDRQPAPAFNFEPEGWASVESYTVIHGKQGPGDVVVVARLESTNERFLAIGLAGDSEVQRAFVDADGLKQRIYVRWHQGQNKFALSEEAVERALPLPSKQFQAGYEFVQVERRGHVLEVTINRPESNNALTPEANEELSQIFDAFEADRDLWIAILTGAGTRAFCTGNDLKVTASGRRMWVPQQGFAGLTARRGRTKTVICAVNGFAMGGGFEIALACDLIVADEAAQFALSEVRVGLLAGAGGLQRLTRQIPLKQAMEMILTGRRVGAEEGRSLGFVNRVVPAGTALQGARELAETLLECSPTSLRLTKQLLNEQESYPDVVDAVKARYRAVDELVASADMMEGLTAFAQKRKPQWRNR